MSTFTRHPEFEPSRQIGLGRIPFASRKLRSRSHSVSVVFLALYMLINLDARAQKPTISEVEAAYLYNFAKYVRWPPQHAGGFEICVLGSDPFGSALDQITRGEQIGGEPLSIRRLHAVSDALGCRILFLGNSESKRLQQDMSVVGIHPILTVSDIDDFAQRGGTIQFVNDDGRVRFIINRTAAEKAGLVLSSELLKVAKLVLPDAGMGSQ